MVPERASPHAAAGPGQQTRFPIHQRGRRRELCPFPDHWRSTSRPSATAAGREHGPVPRAPPARRGRRLEQGEGGCGAVRRRTRWLAAKEPAVAERLDACGTARQSQYMYRTTARWRRTKRRKWSRELMGPSKKTRTAFDDELDPAWGVNRSCHGQHGHPWEVRCGVRETYTLDAIVALDER